MKFPPIRQPRERKKIHQWYYRADDIEHKTKLLVNLLQQPEATRAIVFVRKRERVHELANWLREAGINTCWLEGEMVQAKRNEAIKRLTDGRRQRADRHRRRCPRYRYSGRQPRL
ncbi:ATP-dependent RNA helicase SrmB [Klebsiella pneumoniae subsp. ozaenae]|uniref:ATP-dependent RNA helicase SrmB n=1 Tax=Klebsiella pneumoniae subsp. ozaenae TaxID=574 RepID=A0A377Z7Y3_KLEPO|nr:ATP-dependent RNA helicase SrmB [Klebsiella pneumoniae subsp. ozaenae]